jgi:lipopolysaccharide cholinephosphotransferase
MKISSSVFRKIELDILLYIDSFCKEHGIQYYLAGGSLLGAIRHKGFIPWDDDIDVCVMREDWEKFIEALKKDLDDKFYFQCFETDKKFNVINGPTMKVRKKGTYIEEVNFLLKNRCKSGNGIFVDVIIYDNISESKFKDELNRTVIKLLMPFYVLIDNLHIPHVGFSKFIRWYSEKYARRNEKSKLVSQPISVPWEKFMHEPVFLKEDVFPFKEYEFEGRKFYSYNNIEKILKQWYGPNCLKKWDGEKWIETLPVEKRKPKHTAYINLNGESKEK